MNIYFIKWKYIAWISTKVQLLSKVKKERPSPDTNKSYKNVICFVNIFALGVFPYQQYYCSHFKTNVLYRLIKCWHQILDKPKQNQYHKECYNNKRKHKQNKYHQCTDHTQCFQNSYKNKLMLLLSSAHFVVRIFSIVEQSTVYR